MFNFILMTRIIFWQSRVHGYFYGAMQSADGPATHILLEGTIL